MHIAILAIICSLGSMAFASGPQGDLTPWLGEYTVTKCIQCTDHKVDSGENTKNFVWFGIGSGQIEDRFKLDCAQTNVWVGFGFEIKSDDGSASNVVNRGSGQCDWDYDESLVATADTFTYQTKGVIHGDKVTLTLKRTGPNTFEVYRHEVTETPSWGYPKDLEYKVEAKKTK